MQLTHCTPLIMDLLTFDIKRRNMFLSSTEDYQKINKFCKIFLPLEKETRAQIHLPWIAFIHLRIIVLGQEKEPHKVGMCLNSLICV